MHKLNPLSSFALLLFLFSGTSAYAAEVVFIGDGGAADSQAPYPEFSTQQRIDDLMDFDSYGDYGADRSGMISGTLQTSFEHAKVSGNKSKSFYKDSTTLHQSDLSLQVHEKLMSNYRFEGQADIRTTSNERVENQEQPKFKQLNLKVLNPENSVEFGNFYSEFSSFTMGSSLEGFNAEVSPKDSKFEYKAVMARLNDAEIGQNQRNVYGAHVAMRPFAGNDVTPHDLKIGVQSVLTRDDGSSAPKDFVAAVDLHNWVVSTDGSWRHHTNGFAADWELAFSEYNADRDSASSNEVNDSAFRISPSYRYGSKFDVRYLYYVVGPDFYTMTGSAVRDKQQHQINANYKFSSAYTLSATQNWYWDNLTGSDKTKRTNNTETTLSLTARPLEDRQSFSIRPYVKRMIRDSDDAANSSSADTMVYGVSANDTYKEASIGAFLEKRDYKDRSGSGNSEDYLRYGMNFSRDFDVNERPLYISASYSGSVRDPNSETGREVQNGFSFNGRYQIAEPYVVTFGHNMLTTDSAGNVDDYDTNTSYVEYLHKLEDKRNSELKFRGERNDYNYDDNTEDYRENRFVATLVTHF